MTEWTALTHEQKRDLLRPLIETHGLSYGQIARQLGISRTAVAGAAHRNGLVSPYNPGNNGHNNGPRKLKTSAPKSRIAPTQPIAPPDAFVDRTPIKPKAWEPLPGTTPKSLEELGNHDCKWPLGAAPHSFCGQPAAPGKIYCDVHAALAYHPRPEEQRKKGTNHG